MKEIAVGDIIFKVRNFLPYTQLDKLRFDKLQSTQIKMIKYQSLLPKREFNEIDKNYVERLEKMVADGRFVLTDDLSAVLLEAANETKLFTRRIDELLIEEPKMVDCRPTTVAKLKATPEYKFILDEVQKDLQSLQNPDGTDQSKKA